MFLVFQLLVIGIVGTTTSSSSGEINAGLYRNIVVIPDIHGDIDSLILSLWTAFVEIEGESISFAHFGKVLRSTYDIPVDGQLYDYELLSQYPFETLVIQMGDVFDRGPHGMSCFLAVAGIPRTIGWPVVRLWGNHELMNHLGTSGSFVHSAERNSWAAAYGRKSARDDEFKTDGSLWNELLRNSLLMVRVADPTERDHTRIDSASTLFVHGGVDHHWIDEMLEQQGVSTQRISLVNKINKFAATTISSASIPSAFDLSSSVSPLWNRDLALVDEDYVCERHLPSLLKRFGVSRIVVGHTPQMDQRMKSLCEGRIVLSDSAMSAWMRKTEWTEEEDRLGDGTIVGNPSVLVMRTADMQSMMPIYWDFTLCPLASKSTWVTNKCIMRPGGLMPKSSPSKFLRVVPSSVTPGVVPVSFVTRGYTQQFSPDSVGPFVVGFFHRAHNSAMFGIPRVISPGLDSSSGAVVALYEAEGQSLNLFTELVPIFVRQLVQIVLDLLSVKVLAGPFSKSSFIVDTGVVKLIDFELTKFAIAAPDLETELSRLLKALQPWALKSHINLISILTRMEIPNLNLKDLYAAILAQQSALTGVELLVHRLGKAAISGVPSVGLSGTRQLVYKLPDTRTPSWSIDFVTQIKRIVVDLHAAKISLGQGPAKFLSRFLMDPAGKAWLWDLDWLVPTDDKSVMAQEFQAFLDELRTAELPQLVPGVFISIGPGELERIMEYRGSSFVAEGVALRAQLREPILGLPTIMSVQKVGSNILRIVYTVEPAAESFGPSGREAVRKMGEDIKVIIRALHARSILLGTDSVLSVFGMTENNKAQLLDLSHLRVAEFSELIDDEYHRIGMYIHGLVQEAQQEDEAAESTVKLIRPAPKDNWDDDSDDEDA